MGYLDFHYEPSHSRLYDFMYKRTFMLKSNQIKNESYQRIPFLQHFSVTLSTVKSLVSSFLVFYLVMIFFVCDCKMLYKQHQWIIVNNFASTSPNEITKSAKERQKGKEEAKEKNN